MTLSVNASAAAPPLLPPGISAQGLVEVDWAGPVAGGEIVDEVTAHAVCGLMHVHGRSRGEPSGMGIDYAGTAARVLGGAAVLAALLANTRGAAISRVRTSVAQAALLTVSQYLAAACADDGEAVPIAPGGPPFRGADGVLFEVDTLDPEVWRAFWTALGAPVSAVGAGWRPFQFRYATAVAPLPAVLHELAGELTFAELTAIAQRTGMSICQLMPLSARAREVGEEQPWVVRPLPGRYQRDPAAGRALPLTGMVVLEAGRRVQAPLAAHLLSLLGARVTRIEPPGGDPLRGMPPTRGDISARWLALNRHKDAVEIDIKDPRGRAELRELAAGADVFLHNWAPGKAEHLGLGAEDLAAVSPGLVYAVTSGYADRIPDPPLGTDFMVQARTGLGASIRPDDEPPAPSLMALVDVLGGLLGAHAILGALLHRERTGQAYRVESSLLAAADLLQANAFRAIAAGGSGRPPAGFRRPLRTADGWCAPADRDASAAAGLAARVRDMSTVDAIGFLDTHGLHAAPVTDDLADIPGDARFAAAVRPDERGCPAVLGPWSLR